LRRGRRSTQSSQGRSDRPSIVVAELSLDGLADDLELARDATDGPVDRLGDLLARVALEPELEDPRRLGDGVSGF
jgi:hypothetical protein